MLNKENWSEITDINKWADGMLTALLEHEISYMIAKKSKKMKTCKGCKFLFTYDEYHSYATCSSPKNNGCADPSRCKEA